MYCKNCGKEITDSSKFCPFCGAGMENFSQENPASQLSLKAASKDEELKKYIKDSLDSGSIKKEIEAALKNSGWPQDKIKNAFSEILQQKPHQDFTPPLQGQSLQQQQGTGMLSQQTVPLQGGVPVQPMAQQPLDQTQQAASQFVYAGFWIRLVSYIIDAIIIGAIWWVLETFIGGMLASSISNIKNPTQGEALSFVLILNIFSVIVSWLYFALLESSKKQGTVGKMILGLKVADVSYQKISFGKATGRYFAKILSGLIFGIGYLMIAWDEEKQGLHDKIAKTYVIKARED